MCIFSSPRILWYSETDRVVIRERNIGLAEQWRMAWVPESEDEAAFIFEDDTEVGKRYADLPRSLI